MTVGEFEEAVWNLEGIRIVIRAATNVEVEDYEYANAAQWNSPLTRLFRNRIGPRLDDNAFVIIDGSGRQPHGGTYLQTVRESYGVE